MKACVGLHTEAQAEVTTEPLHSNRQPALHQANTKMGEQVQIMIVEH